MLEFAHEGERAGGRAYWAPISGRFVSSTRAEAIAALFALHCRGPVVLGVDNAGVVPRLRSILADSCGHRRPWQLARDGDIWCQVQDAVRARGVGTTF
eukprot:8871979-Alexandrium_andersonii.AAC.1